MLALFDLDNTLLAGDSDHAFGDYLAHIGWVDAQSHRQQNDRFYADYCSGTLDILAYSQFVLQPLCGRAPIELATLQQTYVDEVIKPLVLPAAIELLEQHRQAGDTLVIVTATNRFITEPIARLLNVPHLIATEGEVIEGRYTGRISGIPCFQQGKVQRVEEWLGAQQLNGIYSRFYSDSFNDLPLLTWANEAVVVDADAKLQGEAIKRGWPQISLRNNNPGM